MKISFLFILLGGLLAASTLKRKDLWRWRQPIREIVQDAAQHKLRTTWFEGITFLVALCLIVTGIYLAFTWR